MTERFYWRGRLVKAGPWVGVMSWFGPPMIDGEEIDRSHRWQCLVRTETTSRAILFGDACPIEVEDLTIRNIERIEQADYLYLRDHAAYATAHAPHMPDAAPKVAINKRGKSVS